ncbi:P-type conjugative transfer protein TrbJ, partial [Mesorhizobium sp. M7A.F.Ca.US.014.04.1.1]|uniref:P-type conjugative transfer protein TrbJ n=1 Tax=Mesorhizobium sp. M7A.F.Ca.US.014.04.1.1 TaxID=2496744 RepID=UPI000FCC14A6
DQIEGNFSQMKSLLGEANKLAYNVQDIDSQFTSAYENFGTDLSSQQLVDGARERWRTSVSAFEHSLKPGAVPVDNIDATQQQTSALVDASQSAVGVLQATQAGNQLLAVQARQVADLTAMLAAQGRAAALEQARTAAAQEQAREQFSRFMTGSRYTASSVKMFHD